MSRHPPGKKHVVKLIISYIIYDNYFSTRREGKHGWDDWKTNKSEFKWFQIQREKKNNGNWHIPEHNTIFIFQLPFKYVSIFQFQTP